MVNTENSRHSGSAILTLALLPISLPASALNGNADLSSPLKNASFSTNAGFNIPLRPLY